MTFFTDSAVSDKIQQLNSWTKPWELVRKLPSLKKILYTAYRPCTHGDPKDPVNMAKEEMIPILKI